MKTAFFVLLIVSLANPTFAESVKERLKRARAIEAGAVETASMAAETTQELSNPEAPAVEEITQCQQDAVYKDGKSYYFECHCKELRYPEIEKMLAEHGLTLVSVGITELGDGTTHFDPKERVKYRYRCGFEILWGQENKLNFKDVNSCYDFVKRIIENVKGNVLFSTRTLNYGCGNHVIKK